MTTHPVLFSVKSALFIGSYVRVPLRISGKSGIDFDDLEFTVSPDDGSTVSPSRDARFDMKKPHIMLLAGDNPGRHELTATQTSTGTVVGHTRFRVTNRWSDPLKSPSHWVNGAPAQFGPQPTWGGGTGTGPQNVPVTRQVGTRKVVVVFVDTTDARYPTTGTTLADAQGRWRQNVADGVVGADGVSRSVARYYREVSYHNGTPTTGMDITAVVLPDVVHLTTGWAANFSLDVNSNWAANSTFCNSVIAAGGVAKFAGANMVVCVVQPVSTSTVTRIAWPYGGYTASGSSGPPNNITVSARGVVMSNTWGDGTTLDQGGGRTVFETLTHELGHTLNLPDAYSPVVADRNVGVATLGGTVSWDPMDWEDPWPHFAAAHRLMLGWIDPAWIKCFNFSALGNLVDEEIVLAPIEHGAPFPNAFLGIEVRVADGRNYYFEYRRSEVGEIGDVQLTPNARVLGTDVTAATTTRPDILLLAKHTDDDGAVLNVGQKYHEIDSTTPTYPVDFRFEVISIAPDMARVRVRYEVTGKPDPMIRPWPRDAAHPWQSPDIEISNAKSIANAQFANVPWNGHPNTITAKVSNGGTLSAPGVTAKFYWKDYTIGGAPETFIASDTHDVGSGATVNFQVTWTPQPPADPASQQHYCVIVRIDPYSTPTTPAINEADPGNNLAQSNYAQFISATASPASREISHVTIGNPYGGPARFFIRPGQNNPLYRTYLEHTCVTLEPGEVRDVDVMFEHAPDSPRPENVKPEVWKRLQGQPNMVNFVGLIENPYDNLLHGPSLLSGADARVLTGRATKFDGRLNVDGEVVAGRVVTVDNGKPVPGGHVVVVSTSKGEGPSQYETVEVDKGGRFRGIIRPPVTEVTAHYVPPPGFGECVSEPHHE